MNGGRTRTYGGRLRIGAIVPPTNAGTETEFARMAPAGVSTLATRLPTHLDLSPDATRHFHDELAAAAKLLGAAGVGVVAYACTIGSIMRTHEEIVRSAEAARCPVVTTARAVVEALRALRLGRVALVSPYDDELNRHEVEFLEAQALVIPRALGLGITPDRFSELAYLGLDDAIRLVSEADGKDVEGFFLSCTDFASCDAIAAIEERFGKPLVTSNQATLWAALRAGGITEPQQGFGRLLGLPVSASPL